MDDRNQVDGELIGNPVGIEPAERPLLQFEHEQTGQLLNASELELRAILNSGVQSIVLIGPDYKIRAFNNLARVGSKRILGKVMAIGDSVYDYIAPEDRAEFNASFEEALRGRSVRLEKHLLGQDGVWRWFEFFYNPVLADGGQTIGVGLNVMPISERKQAEAERARFIYLLRTAAEVSNELTAILDIEQLLYKVVTLLRSRFKLYHVHVYLMNEAEDDLVMQVGSGKIGRLLRRQAHHISLSQEHSLVARAARTREIVFADNVHREADFLANPLLPETQTEVAVPLIAGETVVGVLDIQDRTPSRFGQADLDVFQILAGQIATALHNARLFEERKQAEAVFHQYAARLEALRRIDRDILAARLPETIAQIALSHVRYMIPCVRGSVVEFDLEPQEANVLAAFLHDQTETPQKETLPAEMFNSRILKQGRIYVVHDIRALISPSPLERVILEEGIHSYLNAPLHVRGDLIGSLNIGSDKPNSFTTEHLDIVEEVATSLAIAIQQARLYEQARQDAETKATLLHEVNHRVKNNLAAIVGLLYIEQQHTGMEKQPTFQAIMKDLINRIEGLATVHQMLSASQWSPLCLGDLAAQIIRSVLQAFPSEHRVSSFITSPEAVWVTPEQASSLGMIINEMATNTIKYALPAREAVSIFVDIATTDEIITLKYQDNGPGFPEAILRLEHHNVGIYLIHNIVRRDLQGDVTLSNDNGAVVTIQFKAMGERKKKWS